MNLEKLNVKELTVNEKVKIEGGCVRCDGVDLLLDFIGRMWKKFIHS